MSVGVGLLTVKVAALLNPPPGVGVKAVTLAVPDAATLSAVMVALN